MLSCETVIDERLSHLFGDGVAALRAALDLLSDPVGIVWAIRDDSGAIVFTMFKRGHGDEIEGTGIGLAVCRKIVGAHGGSIWAEPAGAGGTVVCFTMPALQ